MIRPVTAVLLGHRVEGSRSRKRREAFRRCAVVDAILGAAVAALVGVADDAVAGLDPSTAAVEGELPVADVAVGDRDVFTRQFFGVQSRAGGGDEVVGDVDRVGHVHGRRPLCTPVGVLVPYRARRRRSGSSGGGAGPAPRSDHPGRPCGCCRETEIVDNGLGDGMSRWRVYL